MKIVTLTPNPALDFSGTVEALVPNEKNYVHDERRDPGGNGINAARVARRLGASSVLALGFAGGSTGDEVISLLQDEGVAARFTRIREYTRINVTVSDQATHRQTRLTFHGPSVTAIEVGRLCREIGRLRGPGLFVIGGSLPPGCPKDFHARVARVAAARGFGIVADVPAKWIPRLLSGPPLLLLKPNQAELEEWRGRRLGTDRAIAQAARELARRSALVCVSLAERGAILATRDQAWFARAPRVRARGTVGAGDSMVGAICARLARWGITRPETLTGTLRRREASNRPVPIPRELQDALAWGLAAGAATAMAVGTAQAEAAEVRRLLRKVGEPRVIAEELS